jgi:hypothetical protein
MLRMATIFDSLKQNDAAVSSFHIDPLKKSVLFPLNRGSRGAFVRCSNKPWVACDKVKK